MNSLDPSISAKSPLVRAIRIIGWVYLANFVVRLFSVSLIGATGFEPFMEIVAQSGLPADEANWVLAWTEFAIICTGLFYIGVALYAFTLMRELALFLSGGRARATLGWEPHACLMFMFMVIVFLTDAPAMNLDPATSAKLLAFGVPGWGALVSLLGWGWSGLTLWAAFDPRKLEAAADDALAHR